MAKYAEKTAIHAKWLFAQRFLCYNTDGYLHIISPGVTKFCVMPDGGGQEEVVKWGRQFLRDCPTSAFL